MKFINLFLYGIASVQYNRDINEMIKEWLELLELYGEKGYHRIKY